MPTFKITDPSTGKSIKLTGDSPPTEAELNQIFAQLAGGQPAQLQTTLPEVPPQVAPAIQQAAPAVQQEAPLIPQAAPLIPQAAAGIPIEPTEQLTTAIAPDIIQPRPVSQFGISTRGPLSQPQGVAPEIGVQPAQPQQVPISEFPLQPGESRAAKELPEILDSGLLAGQDRGKLAAISPALLLTIDPVEFGNIVTDTFSEIGMQFSPGGEVILVNNKTGVRAVINQPGLSKMDVMQALGLLTAFVPVTKAVGAVTTLFGKAAAGAAASAATQTGIEALQASQGGEFNEGEVATAAALGAIAEFAQPGIAAIAGKAKSLTKPVAELVGETLATALQKGKVLTSDVFPPNTFIGKAFQKVSERVPFIGTGGIRAAQQRSRREAVQDFAAEFDINAESNFGQDIINAVDRIFKRSQKRASELRTEAVDALKPLGDVPATDAKKAVIDEIVKIRRLGERGDASLEETLRNIFGELSGDFERLKDIRTTIFGDISDVAGIKSPIRSGGDAALKNVASALSKDLLDFADNAKNISGASKEVRKAANKWMASNRIFARNITNAKETELKKLLGKGKITPEVVQTVIKGGKQSELDRLFANTDLSGRESVRQQILQNALQGAGFPDQINPTIFLNQLNRINVKKAVSTFFTGADKKQLEGLKKFLDITRRAQEEAASIASQQEITTAGLIGGAALAPAATIGIGGTIGLSARAFESQTVRDLLIKLSAAKPDSKKADDIMKLLRPLIISQGQQTGGQ